MRQSQPLKANVNPSLQGLDLAADAPCAMTRAGLECDLHGICESIRHNARRRIRLRTGHMLYAQGDRVESVFCVQNGCLKSVTIDADGEQQVHAFHLPGDLVGFDGLGASQQPEEAVAVKDSEVSTLPLEGLYDAVGCSAANSRSLLGRLGRALAQANARGGEHPVDVRVAAFLVDMRRRIAPEAASVTLPMPRRDIASNLRIAPETLSRSPRRLTAQGLISANGRRVGFLRPDELAALAGSHSS